ncbi:MAG: AraC family transcriptional regulator [Ruthenibacterium sp.]
MLLCDLDKKEYANIPIYPIGSGEVCSLPISISQYTSKSRTLSPLHRHEVVQINYILRGSLEHEVNGARYKLVKGDIFVIPPFVPHRLVGMETCDAEIVELEFAPEFIFGREHDSVLSLEESKSVFDFSYIEPFLVSECNIRPGLNLQGKNQQKAEELLAELLEEHALRRDGFLLAMKADLLKILVLAGRAMAAQPNSSQTQLLQHHREAIATTLASIEAHLDAPVSIDEAARMALLSTSYFSYLFKILMGKTFVEYLHDLRIQKAMQLLTQTNHLVVDISYECGFNNVNHFNRIFKAVAGVSPKTYRLDNRSR